MLQFDMSKIFLVKQNDGEFVNLGFVGLMVKSSCTIGLNGLLVCLDEMRTQYLPQRRRGLMSRIVIWLRIQSWLLNLPLQRKSIWIRCLITRIIQSVNSFGIILTPRYVLERHLRREEALKPGSKPIRKFISGKGEKARKEVVYHRKDVYICRTVENWCSHLS